MSCENPGKGPRDALPEVDLSEVSLSYLLPGCQHDIMATLWSWGGGAEKAALMQDGGCFWFLLTHSGLLQGQIR